MARPKALLFSQENTWLWLRQSLEKAARQGDKISESSILVRVVGKCLHEIEAEISRWRDILAVEYAQFLRGELILHPIVDLH